MSKRSADVIALGNRLVDELGLNNHCDTLGKWMAHYLAGLLNELKLQKSPTKKKAVQRECCVLIERLWAKRQNLPGSARPLGRFDEALDALMAMNPDGAAFPEVARRALDGSENPWFLFARDSHAADRELASIAFLTGILENDLGREKRWVTDHASQLSEEEQKLIEALNDWVDSRLHLLSGGDQSAVTSLPVAERNERIISKLEKSLQDQVNALERLKQRIRQPKSPTSAM